MINRMLLPQLSQRVEKLLATQEAINTERKKLLGELSEYIRLQRLKKQSVKLIFICTHNSRRSQMAEAWAHAAAYHFGLNDVQVYSGGTEVTAFHPNAVQALVSAGFSMQARSTGSNPVYHVAIANGVSWEAWSKVYDDTGLPHKSFAAVMTCSEADAACPVVPGADARFPIRYQDPKITDGTPRESATYASRADEIGREMLFVMQHVAGDN